MRKFVLWDIGRVVVDFDDQKARRALGQLAGRFDNAQVLSLLSGPLWLAYAAGKLTDHEYREAVRRRLRMSDKVTDEQIDQAVADVFTPIQSTMSQIWRLKEAGVVQVAVSNAEPSRVRRLEAMGVRDMFDHTVFSCEARLVKPDQAIYRKALELAGAQPEQAMFIDDLVENVLAAAELGIASHQYKNPEGLLRFLQLHGHCTEA